MRISEMNGNELLMLAEELGAETNETFEESAKRFRENGDEETARKFNLMTNRWYEIEG